jgi:hypothetical protein
MTKMTDNSSVAFQNCNLCTSLSAKVHWIGDYTISCYRYDESLTTDNFRDNYTIGEYSVIRK